MPNNYRTPITRNNLFYSPSDFDLETDIVMGYMEEDLNQTVVVYQVDREKTGMNAVYQESTGNVKYKSPKEIPCIYEIKDAEIKAYDSQSNNGVYTINGGLTVHVLEKVLEKYDCDIRRGDYIGVLVDTNRMVYFSVVNDGKINTANSLYIGAHKPAYRVVTASPTTSDEFNGL